MHNVYVDANTGEVVKKVNLLSHVDTPGTGATYYSGTQNITMESHNGSYRLRESGRNIQTFDATNSYDFDANGLVGSVDYSNSSTDWGAGSSTGNPALDVHWGMEMTYDFYLNELNHDSYDNNGSVIKNYINPFLLQTDFGNDPNNAAALGSPYNIMVYGLGDGSYMDHVVGIDVEGHEYTHLVVDNNGNGGLEYLGESGALNESFADIFGTCVEFYANNNPDWLIGEDVTLMDPYMRSMSNPNSAGQPDTYNGNMWIDPANVLIDNGGVHINSGVMNYWFYLLSEGGSGVNDLGNSYSVTPIGMDAARDIAYRNLMNYLTSSSNYVDAYNGSLQATEDLYGINSAEYTAVEDAWYAVGIDENTVVPEGFCSQTTTLTESSGTFSDGSGNEDYNNTSFCSWLIQPENATEVYLTFTEFDTEQGYDYVFVFDGDSPSAPMIADLSGSSLPDPIVSSGPSLLVIFFSDSEITAGGFTANYNITMGVEENIFKNEISVYPNPANGYFTVNSQLDEEVNAEILNILGKKVSDEIKISKGENKIDVPQLSTGIYLLKLEVNNKTEFRRIIIE